MLPDPAHEPAVVPISVVIATRNRVSLLERCLDALAPQVASILGAEIVVIDDGSSDGTPALLASRSATGVRWEAVPHGGQAAAQSRGIALARGETCLLIDDDIIAAPDLVRQHLDAQRRAPGIVIGRIDIVPRAGDWLAGHFASRWQAHHARRLVRGATFTDAWTGNLSLPRTAFLRAGGMATDLPRGWDVEMAWRLSRAGVPIRFIDEAVGTQDDDKSGSQLLHDAIRSGAGEVVLWRRWPELLGRLTLGRFAEGHPLEILVRRWLLAARASPRAVARAGRVLGTTRAGAVAARITLAHAYWSGVRNAVDAETWARLTNGLLVLMYHAVGDPGEPASRYVIPAPRLRSQLDRLKASGHRLVDPAAWLRAHESGELLAPRSVLITFDDAYEDTLRQALPILQAHGAPPAVFVPTAHVGGSPAWERTGSALGRRRLLDWAGIQQLATGGALVGAHGRTHTSLRGMASTRLDEEVSGSATDLERQLGQRPAVFAYPYGHADPAAVAAVERARYTVAFGVDEGWNTGVSPPFRLRRVEIRGTDSALRFRVVLLLGSSPRPGRLLRRAVRRGARSLSSRLQASRDR